MPRIPACIPALQTYQNRYKMKRIEWLGTSLNAVRDFPQDARLMIGQELQLVQAGFMPSLKGHRELQNLIWTQPKANIRPC